MSKAEAIYEKVQGLPDSTQSAVLRMVESLADTSAGPHQHGGLAAKFQELVEIWRRETMFLSFMQQRALHPAYQRIIGMGPAVLPRTQRRFRSYQPGR